MQHDDAVIANRHTVAPVRCDLAIVGGGILGLAAARELHARHPALSLCVLEREDCLGEHQTGHNSGVIHAGIYYAPGSLKARLCVEGATDLYRYCQERDIPHRRCGKLIIARDRSELAGLHELHRRGLANGVPGLRLLDREGIEELEPHARGLAGLHSPGTGIVDFKTVAGAFAEDLSQSGVDVVNSCAVTGMSVHARTITLLHSQGATEASHALFCAGAWSDRLARTGGAPSDPRIVPFAGAYLAVKGQATQLVRSLIYPVPDATLPFLGVHLTRVIGGELLIGPTALLAMARDGHGLRGSRSGGWAAASTVALRDAGQTLSWPGSWRMLGRYWRTGITELRHAASTAALVRAAARYVPALEGAEVERAFTGIRAQALRRNGDLVDDFLFSGTGRALHVRNAPSPAATSSIAIARHIADQAQRSFGDALGS
jgi:(S)-2-hydroxyglutarate dehydrogenase